MNNKAWAVARINLRTMGALYFAVFNTALAFVISIGLGIFLSSGYAGPAGISAIPGAAGDALTGAAYQVTISSSGQISPANALWLLMVMVPLALPTYSFKRIMNLGGKRNSFFWGALLTYVILAAVSALIMTVSSFAIEPLFEQHYHFNHSFFGGIANLVEVFGWAQRGPAVAFIQQLAFFILLAAFVHTLAAAQGRWYGWAANLAIVAIIAVFTPIAPLRAVLGRFFNLILLHPSAVVQVAACLALAAGFFGLSKIVLDRKVV